MRKNPNAAMCIYFPARRCAISGGMAEITLNKLLEINVELIAHLKHGSLRRTTWPQHVNGITKAGQSVSVPQITFRKGVVTKRFPSCDSECSR
jgi:hypothetical protein